MGPAGQVPVQPLGLPVRPDPLRRLRQDRLRRALGGRTALGARVRLGEERLQVRHRLQDAARLEGPADVLGVAAAGRGDLGDQRVQLVQPDVHRAQPLMVHQREVVELHPQGLDGDLGLHPLGLDLRDLLLQLLFLGIGPPDRSVGSHVEPHCLMFVPLVRPVTLLSPPRPPRAHTEACEPGLAPGHRNKSPNVDNIGRFRACLGYRCGGGPMVQGQSCTRRHAQATGTGRMVGPSEVRRVRRTTGAGSR